MKETMIFIGAGFTAQLGLPTSFKQNEIFKSFFYDCDTAKYRELFNEINDACESDDELKERIVSELVTQTRIWSYNKGETLVLEGQKLLGQNR